MNIDSELRKELLYFSVGNKKDPTAFIVYTYLLCKANHSDTVISDNKTEDTITINRGQTITSFRKLSEETGLSEQQVRTAVKKLISAKYITQRSTRYYTIFTLCHYDRKTNTGSAEKQKKNGKSIKPHAGGNIPSAADRQRYLQLCEKISHSPLTDEEKEFFNNYDYNEE